MSALYWLDSKLSRIARTAVLPYPYRHHNRHTRSIFIHIPKTAGSSILQAVGAPVKGRLHIDYSHFEKADSGRFRRYFKFAVVREPLDRLYSCYRYLLRGGNGESEDLAARNLIMECSRGFDEFVHAFVTPQRMCHWPLLRPQSYYICDRFGECMMDQVLRYESLDDDYQLLRSRVSGLSAVLPRVNVSEKRGGVKVHPSTVEKVRELYACDYRLFYPKAQSVNVEFE